MLKRFEKLLLMKFAGCEFETCFCASQNVNSGKVKDCERVNDILRRSQETDESSPLDLQLANQVVPPKRKKRRKNKNEIYAARTRLQRPLNTVDIDKLYQGYRGLNKCTKGKACQCYHCELLRASDVSNQSGESETSNEGDGGMPLPYARYFKFSNFQDSGNETEYSFISPQTRMIGKFIPLEYLPLQFHEARSDNGEKIIRKLVNRSHSHVIKLLLHLFYALRCVLLLPLLVLNCIFCRIRNRIHPELKRYVLGQDIVGLEKCGDEHGALLDVSVHDPP